ncbi:MAG: type VI secretion system membrane subunit TssM [Aquisalimonadaceae bacterium]
MKAFISLIRQRWVLGLIGVILFALLIWFIGPYLALGPFVPLESALARGLTIALVIGGWVLLAVFRRYRARQASQRLGAAIVAGGGPEDDQGEALRRRFEEAIDFLRQSKRSKNLYELPWYVIVGPPGSGKTTALIHSGLNFPLDQKYGRDALRGVGGTRNCDWWFTDEAVLLDTAGRYFTQDSDASSDAAEWRGFLDLLCNYRKRRPINGVLVTLSATDLLTQTPQAHERHVATVRRRVNELQQHLKVQVPVYFMVTKCDLIAGFVEFFDDLGHEGRAQVWGITRPEPVAGGNPEDWFDAEYDALLERLDGRLLARLDQEREPRRRARLFGFPRQMSGLRQNLLAFIRDTFGGTGFDRAVMLRGVYFTSGTQEGTPIDRMMDSLARAYGVSASDDVAVPAAGGQGRSYFIHRLLKDVVFPESGLAGVNWRFEVGRAVAQNVAYLALLGLLGVLVAGWATSYRYNSAYLADVSAALETHAELATAAVPAEAGLIDVLPRLDALGEVATEANRYRSSTPWLMGLGLYRGGTIGDAAGEAYLQGVRELLVPRVALLLDQRLRTPNTPATDVYAYLKGYLMLAQPERLDHEELDAIVEGTLVREFSDQRAIAQALAAHFSAYSASARSLPGQEVDEDLVAQARATLAQASIPALMLSRLETLFGSGHRHALRLDLQAGLGGEQVFRRRGGTALSEPVPALYTRAGFETITGDVGADLVARFQDDRWVFGDDVLPSGRAARLDLAEDFLRHYERAYAGFWDELLADLELTPLLGVDQATGLLAAVTGPTSPLRRLMGTVDAQTHFPEPENEGADAGGRLGALLGFVDDVRGNGADKRPGEDINAHFQEFHQFVAGADGAPAPLEDLIALLDRLYGELSALGSGLGDQDAMTLLGRQGGDSLRRLRSEAVRYPPPFNAWLATLAGSGEALAMRSLRSQLNRRYRSEVLPVCAELTTGRYPFDARSDREIATSDFQRLFGPGGVLDAFFNDHLSALVDASGPRWNWRRGEAASMEIPRSVLDQFQRARLIRDLFFGGGANGPQTGFVLTPRYLDARARQFRFTLGEQSLVYRHGPPIGQQFSWPGDSGTATAVAFEDRGGERPNTAYSGGWAWLRALDAAQPAAESDTTYLASFSAGGYSARVLVEFDSSRNPLRNGEWRRFGCPGGL